MSEKNKVKNGLILSRNFVDPTWSSQVCGCVDLHNENWSWLELSGNLPGTAARELTSD